MTEKKIAELIEYLVKEGCDETAVVNLTELKAALRWNEDEAYIENLMTSFEHSGILKIKYRKGVDYCLTLMPKSKMFLTEHKAADAVEKQIAITIPAKKIFFWSFLGSLLAGAIIAVVAVAVAVAAVL